ncbi:exopolysaccharide biosynthesis protein [Prauserella cavernicola]|uniref:Exopolysaccharide biosynthesis protein n=1 Tax=Prauserella cavernicola TaxID=2800127 RepID=A0A934V3W0_9PSEU|nr:exopolysaccharide biosynthesis protein [Prauserella cavernicola]MBK1784119.1 exopolysaccharide biosynthesis protein [Prauserella cavernicola]
MSDEPVRLSMVGQVLRRRWRQLAVLAVLGGLVGAGASLVFSPGYETTTSVLLQGPREENELLTQEQVAMSSAVLDRSAVALGREGQASELRDSVSAEVVDGGVIRITGSSEDPAYAARLADTVAEEFVRYSSQLASNSPDAAGRAMREQQEALRRQVDETNRSITELHAAAADLTVESVQMRTNLEALRTSLAEAVTSLNESEQTTSRSNMVVMGPAPVPVSLASPTMPQFIGGGVLVFLLLGVFGQLLAIRSDKRLRTEDDIAGALGAPVLGMLDEPVGTATHRDATGWTRLRGLVWDDQPLDLAPVLLTGDEQSRNLRVRRILAKLPEHERVLVLAADDDAGAQAAAARLVTTAERGPGGPRATVRVVDVSAGRPTVPDPSEADGVLVMLTAGSRTGWELVGIAEACADAGHRVVGAVVTYRARAQREATTDDAMAGSA